MSLTTLGGGLWRIQLKLTSPRSLHARQVAVEYTSLHARSTGGATSRPFGPRQLCGTVFTTVTSAAGSISIRSNCYGLADMVPKTNAQFTPPAWHDETVLSASCLAWQCELDNCYTNESATVLSCPESNSHRQSGRDTDKTVLSRLTWRCELALTLTFALTQL